MRTQTDIPITTREGDTIVYRVSWGDAGLVLQKKENGVVKNVLLIPHDHVREVLAAIIEGWPT